MSMTLTKIKYIYVMNFVLWLYVFIGATCECSYERVGVFSDMDSLHVVSNKLNYHLRFEGDVKRDEVLLLSNGLDSSFAISGGWAEDGVIIFINDLSREETVVISTRPCFKKD